MFCEFRRVVRVAGDTDDTEPCGAPAGSTHDGPRCVDHMCSWCWDFAAGVEPEPCPKNPRIPRSQEEVPVSDLCGCGLSISNPACCTNTPEVRALVARDEAMDDLIAALDEAIHLDGDTAAKREADDREQLWLDGFLSGYAAGEY